MSAEYEAACEVKSAVMDVDSSLERIEHVLRDINDALWTYLANTVPQDRLTQMVFRGRLIRHRASNPQAELNEGGAS
jgi:hypothetical protein